MTFIRFENRRSGTLWSGFDFCLKSRSKLPDPTHPNHQPLRRPRSPHIEQPRFLALVFAFGAEIGGELGSDQNFMNT